MLDHYVVSALLKDISYTESSQYIALAAGKMTKIQQISRVWILFNVYPLIGVTFQVVIWYPLGALKSSVKYTSIPQTPLFLSLL